ncbi:hypothetical protein SAMN05444166_6055 [Singulisphaera sp. GP187]|uniref:hypothetical protein n=1 Tax=Singulisphaera sp. GP187 TaxID=1882752 RepID=UPI00092B1850|nr:hypothetical protein [Singulisphaera sp. GP187]SIO59447.1 hypothetical protein SAMN05444166_6055 [Singulisphaera sp. GP187]
MKPQPEVAKPPTESQAKADAPPANSSASNAAPVRGQRLEPSPPATNPKPGAADLTVWVLGGATLVLIVGGFLWGRRGA